MKAAGHFRRGFAALVVGSVVASACGGDDDSDTDADAPTTGGAVATSVAQPPETAPTDTEPTGAAATTAPPDDDTTATTAPPDDDTTATTAPAEETEVCTEDRVGGEATMGILSYPPSMDPVENRGSGANGTLVPLAVFDTLVRYDSENDEFVPAVAESLEPNADSSEWTLTLREGVTFGNGDPLTAEIVKASYERHQDPESGSEFHLESLAVVEIEIVDELTLIFKLDGPWLRFPALLAGTPGMVTNQAVVDELGEAFATDPAGGGVGPYVLERWAPGEEIVLTAKDDWWGGPVCIETLRFTFIAGGQPTYDAFRAGEFQLAHIRDAAIAAESRELGINSIAYVRNASSNFSFNNVSGPTADPLVRQAIALAIDPVAIDERVYEGKGLPTTAIISERSVHYQGLEGPQFDPERAAELVEQAKAAGWDGNLKLLCISGPEQEEICLFVQAQLQVVGINAELEFAGVNDVIPRVLRRDYEMAAFGFGVDDTEPWIRLSSSLASTGALNELGYASEEMDAALAAMRSAPDLDSYYAALADIQELWNRDVPKFIYRAAEELVLLDDSIKGMIMIQNTNPYFNYAYIEQ